MGYGCLLDFTVCSQFIRHVRLISGFCSSGYDFAIPSSRLYLTIQTLGVALGFVGNYAPCGLSPQTDGMPVILQKPPSPVNSRLRGFSRAGDERIELPPKVLETPIIPFDQSPISIKMTYEIRHLLSYTISLQKSTGLLSYCTFKTSYRFEKSIP